MKAQFTFLSGARAGQIDVLGQTFISVGRHPLCELKFDPDKDLDVSSRHASISIQNNVYLLRDLGSTNGTFVNGKRLTDDHVLANKDAIQFGQNGPKVEFTILKDVETPAGEPAGPAGGTSVFPSKPPRQAPQNPPPPRRTSGGPVPSSRESPPSPSGSTTQRVRIEVARQTAHLRRTTLGLFALLMVVTGAYFWQNSTNTRALDAQRQAMLAIIDSLTAEVTSLSSSAQSLQGELDSAKTQVDRLRKRIENAPNDSGDLSDLKRQLDAAIRLQRNLAVAARMDTPAIIKANQDAVALVFVQFQDGKTFTGSGFAVKTDPNGSFLFTNKHVVVDTGGRQATKVGVVFNGSNQNFRADIITVHPTEDVALLHVTVAKGTYVVKGLVTADPPIQTGEAVVGLGFPLGLDLPMGGDWSKVGVTATATLGTAAKVLPSVIQLDSYGAEGASGSPVFNRDGKVIGLVYGGQRGSNGRIVFLTPIKFGLELLGSQ